MKILNYIGFNFCFDFFQRGIIHPFYQSISNPITKENFKNKSFIEGEKFNINIQEIKFIPSFLQLNPPTNSNHHKITSFNRVENFYIDLVGFTSVESYLESQMGPKSRSQLRRRIHRLEVCFEIAYKFYYGKIDKQKYDELFDALEQFIERRFIQRGSLYSQKDNLSTIRKNSYQMILEKKASLFVIYSDGKIIDVCLNYHFQNVMQHFIRSYDIDYSKFWLGQIDIYKQLEICLQYNFTIFDFMWDELVYKKRWSNKTATYKHDFIYRKTLINKLEVITLIQLYKIHDWLKTTKIYKSIKARLNRVEKLESKTIKTEELRNKTPFNLYKKISIKDDNYLFLRKTVFDFQYLNFEKTEDINVYKINNESFIISGIKKQIKVYLA